jgi:hypothetical protein
VRLKWGKALCFCDYFVFSTASLYGGVCQTTSKLLRDLSLSTQ